MNNYEVVKYPDGSSYVKINRFEKDITFRINSYEDLWILKQIKDVYDHNNLKLSIYIPNLIDAQADRRFDTNQPHGLKLVCEFINSLKFEKVSIFHPHNPEVIEALIDNVDIVDNSDFIADILFRIDTDNLIMLLPDGGAYKWGVKLANKINFAGTVLSASKNREYKDGKSVLIQQLPDFDFRGKSVIIIDDICIYGGTFVGLYNLLKDRNVGNIYLAVSHMTVSNPNKELEKFTQIFTTDSKGLKYDLNNVTIINSEYELQ